MLVLHLNKLESPSPKVASCQVWLKLEKIFRFCQSFRYFIIISLSWINHHQMMFCAMFGSNWPIGFGEFCYILSMHFRYFVIISPWKWAGPFIWETWISFIQDALSQVWLKLVNWFWWRRWKSEKFTTTMTTSMTDNRQIVIRNAQGLIKFNLFISNR